jgi:hypothetical protein
MLPRNQDEQTEMLRNTAGVTACYVMGARSTMQKLLSQYGILRALPRRPAV